jgi:hypothetical protein
MSDSRPIYTTADELSFIVNLAADNPQAGIRYCRQVLTVPRVWDAGVDIPRVKQTARQVLEETLLRAEAVR